MSTAFSPSSTFPQRPPEIGQRAPLVNLLRGHMARVVTYDEGNGVDSRLRELGLVPGALVRVLHCGRTCLLCVDGSRFSVRCAGLANILVERLG